MTLNDAINTLTDLRPQVGGGAELQMVDGLPVTRLVPDAAGVRVFVSDAPDATAEAKEDAARVATWAEAEQLVAPADVRGALKRLHNWATD
jgi:hypothetical protein